MTTFAQSILSDVLPTTFVEAAEAAVMTELVTAAIATIADAEEGNIIGVTLAGGGDGHTFVTAIDVSSDPIGPDAIEPTTARVGYYLASSEEELPQARAATVAVLLAEPPPGEGQTLVMLDEQLAGAAKGTRFMGLILANWETLG